MVVTPGVDARVMRSRRVVLVGHHACRTAAPLLGHGDFVWTVEGLAEVLVLDGLRPVGRRPGQRPATVTAPAADPAIETFGNRKCTSPMALGSDPCSAEDGATRSDPWWRTRHGRKAVEVEGVRFEMDRFDAVLVEEAVVVAVDVAMAATFQFGPSRSLVTWSRCGSSRRMGPGRQPSRRASVGVELGTRHEHRQHDPTRYSVVSSIRPDTSRSPNVSRPGNTHEPPVRS